MGLSAAASAPGDLYELRRAVVSLNLSHVRCYQTAHVELPMEHVVLTGPNGAGKTTLLEALSFLSPGNGLRGVKPHDILPKGSDENGWAVGGIIRDETGDLSISTGIIPGGARRHVKVQGVEQSTQLSLGERLSVTWLTPAMDPLFVGPPKERRRFLDRIVYSMDTTHADALTCYEKAMKERRVLLEVYPWNTHWLSIIEEAIVEHGLRIATNRQWMINQLNACELRMNGRHEKNLFPKAKMTLQGAVDDWLLTMDHDHLKNYYKQQLEMSRQSDAHRGTCGFGPHKTDILVHHPYNGVPASLCSTGEQKILLMGIVLSAVTLQSERDDRCRLLLLDEVAAHLDPHHQAILFDHILALGVQTWFTGVDPVLFKSLDGAAKFLYIHDGKINEELRTI